jgi:DNA-binding transcriptional MerR regulator
MDTVLLTTAQLAERLGLATITLQVWRAQGLGIPFIKEGHRVFYRLEDVQRYERVEVKALMRWLLSADCPIPQMHAMLRAAGLPLQKIRDCSAEPLKFESSQIRQLAPAFNSLCAPLSRDIKAPLTHREGQPMDFFRRYLSQANNPVPQQPLSLNTPNN